MSKIGRPAEIRVWAASPEELTAHYSIRHQVFVLEQAVISGTDRDDVDADPATIHALGARGDTLAGVVRLYPVDGELWQGDRLAVLPSQRISMVGAELVRFAVATAAAQGGALMHAQVQLPNVRFFERLGWHSLGAPAPYHGLEHQLMSCDLRAARRA